MVTKKQEFSEKLKSFLPIGFENMVADLILNNNVKFKIVKPRQSKLGDFRGEIGKSQQQITINGNLNKYQFLITTLHEFAHLFVFNKYQFSVKAHGEEWKHEYKNLLNKALALDLLPSEIRLALERSIKSIKASTCSDANLSIALSKFDEQMSGEVLLYNLPKNTIFVLNNKKFVKGELLRKRFLCTEIESSKQYLVHMIAKVITEQTKNE